MFAIEEFSRISQGEYRVVITTDDPGFLPALRLIRHVSHTAEQLHERVDRERRVLELTDARQEAAPAQRAERARILALYRELPGYRGERLKALRRILLDQYRRIGYDDVLTVISLAVREERAARRARVMELATAGRSCREIASQLGISPAQASRLSGPRRVDARGCPTIDDLPSGAYPRAVPLGEFSRSEKFQEENGIPEAGAAAFLMGRGVRGR